MAKKAVQTGERGGKFYLKTKQGAKEAGGHQAILADRKVYVKKTKSKAKPKAKKSTKRKIHTGKRGGKYYISKGRKVYVKKGGGKKRPVARGKKVKRVKKVKKTTSGVPKRAYFTITTRYDDYEDNTPETHTFTKAFMDRKGLTSAELDKAVAKGRDAGLIMDRLIKLQIQKFDRPNPVRMTIKKGGKSKRVSF